MTVTRAIYWEKRSGARAVITVCVFAACALACSETQPSSSAATGNEVMSQKAQTPNEMVFRIDGMRHVNGAL